MIRSRIFRLRSFWLGLMGLFFLVWAWSDSMAWQSGLYLQRSVAFFSGTATFGDSVGQSDGALEFTRQWIEGKGSVFKGLKAVRFQSAAIDCFPAPQFGDLRRWPVPKIGVAIVSRRFALPHWLLISCYLPAWAGILVRRWKAAAKREETWKALARPEGDDRESAASTFDSEKI